MSEVKMRIKVSEDCNCCGICSMQYPDYFFETDEGKAQANDTSEVVDTSTLAKIEGLCPVHAITVEKESKSTRQLLAKELEKLEECRVKYPTKKEILFKKEEYSIPIPVASGEHRYEYSSESSANSAARSEFNNKMYSQIDVLILKVITEYRVKYIKPYYSKSAEDNSVYYACNKKAERILTDIAHMLKQEGLDADLPTSFCVVDCYPEEDTVWKMLNNGELLSDEMVPGIKSEFRSNSYSDLSSYETYWDIDDMERPAGTDFRGRMKFKDKYCYRNMREAFQELAKDLISACYYKDDYIMERAVDLVKGLIIEYNEKMEQNLQERIAYIEKKIDAMQEDEGSSIVALEAYPKMMRKIENYKDKPICVNGVEINDKEIFIVDACDGKEQFFYDGKVIKKRFISKGIVKNEVILKDMQPEYYWIIGYDEQILFDFDDCLWRYNCKKNVCEKIVENIFGLYIYKNILIYTVCDNLLQLVKDGNSNVRINSPGSIWCSSFDGKIKLQLKSFGYGTGFIYIKLVNDDNVFYSTLGNKNQGSVDWKIDSFLPDNAKVSDLYTDFAITEEYKQQKLAEEKAKHENEERMIESLKVGDVRIYWTEYVRNYKGERNPLHFTLGMLTSANKQKDECRQYSEQEVFKNLISEIGRFSFLCDQGDMNALSDKIKGMIKVLEEHLYKDEKLDISAVNKYVGYLLDNGISIPAVANALYHCLRTTDRGNFEKIVKDILHVTE